MTTPPSITTVSSLFRRLSAGLAVTAVTAMGVTGCGPKAGSEPEATTQIDVERYRVETFKDEQALGGQYPLVTIIVFSDYACEPCARLWQVMQHLHEDYGDDLRIVYRSFTKQGFNHGERAAEAAYVAASQGKFWPFHWRLFRHPMDFSGPTLRADAEAVGMDVAAFSEDLDTGVGTAPRARDGRQARSLSIPGSPVSFLNGIFIPGYQDEAAWHAIIDEEMKRARSIMRGGVPREELYAAILQNAQARPVIMPEEAKKLRKVHEEKVAASQPVPLTKPDIKARYAVPSNGAKAGGAAFGPEDAPVRVVEFFDFQCPYCRRVATQVLPEFRREFAKEVRWEMRNLPLENHPEAMPAALACLAAGDQGKYWEFHERLFEKKPLDEARYQAIAGELGLDLDRFNQRRRDPALKAQIAEDIALARTLGLSGTPSYFVNGTWLDGAQKIAAFRELTEKELARAAELGVSGAEAYPKLMEGAVPPAEFPNAAKAASQGSKPAP